MPAPSSSAPDLVLLLHADPADAVARALCEGRAPLGCPVLAVSAARLLRDVSFGRVWTVAGKAVHPERTALVNRLPLSGCLGPADAGPEGASARQAMWSRLRQELQRCAYVSSLPTASSLLGCFGSLLDQWQDLPRLVPGLRVPEHATASLPRVLQGQVHTVDRWTPYSLGTPRSEAQAATLPADVRLDYVRPRGPLVHVAQVGRSLFFPHPPATMAPVQQQAVVDTVMAVGRVSPLRILEHAFFVGDDGPPVFYSSCPLPVLSGRHPLYPALVAQGLRDDMRSWRGPPAA